MDNKSIIEKVLDMKISDVQYMYMKNEWKAFSENPERYVNSIVADMVKLDISDIIKYREIV